MNHQEPAVAVVGAVIGVREAGIDRERVIGVRIHQAGRDRIEALGRLTVAFSDLRTEIAGPAADRIDFEQLETAGGMLLPDFELGFFLEDADEDRRFLRHPLLIEQRQHLRRQRLHRLGRQLVAAFRLLLRRRGRIERRVGCRRLVEALDGRRLAQVFHHLRLRAVGDIILDLRLDLFEGRRWPGPLVLDLDDVPAELGLHRVGQLPLAELERHLGRIPGPSVLW